MIQRCQKLSFQVQQVPQVPGTELNVFSIDHRCGIFLERYIFGKVVIQASQKLILQVQHVPQVANLQ